MHASCGWLARTTGFVLVLLPRTARNVCDESLSPRLSMARSVHVPLPDLGFHQRSDLAHPLKSAIEHGVQRRATAKPGLGSRNPPVAQPVRARKKALQCPVNGKYIPGAPQHCGIFRKRPAAPQSLSVRYTQQKGLLGVADTPSVEDSSDRKALRVSTFRISGRCVSAIALTFTSGRVAAPRRPRWNCAHRCGSRCVCLLRLRNMYILLRGFSLIPDNRGSNGRRLRAASEARAAPGRHRRQWGARLTCIKVLPAGRGKKAP